MYPHVIRHPQLIRPKLRPLSTYWYTPFISMNILLFFSMPDVYKCNLYKSSSYNCSFVYSDNALATTTFTKQVLNQTKPFWLFYNINLNKTLRENSLNIYKYPSDFLNITTHISITLSNCSCYLYADLDNLTIHPKRECIRTDQGEENFSRKISLFALSNLMQINKSARADLLRFSKIYPKKIPSLYADTRDFVRYNFKNLGRCLIIFQLTNCRIPERDQATSLTQTTQVTNIYNSGSYPASVILNPPDVRPHNV